MNYKTFFNYSAKKEGLEPLNEIAILKKELALKNAEIAALKRQALEDPLTGLLNRRALEREMAAELSSCNRHGHSSAFCFIDIDSFKNINDSLGHHTGDALLKHIAKLLQSHVRESDTVARLAGDEFCLILRETSPHNIQRKINHLSQVIATTPCLFEGKKVFVTVSMGATPFSEARTKADLITKSDKAMYAQKQKGTFERLKKAI